MMPKIIGNNNTNIDIFKNGCEKRSHAGRKVCIYNTHKCPKNIGAQTIVKKIN